MQTLSSADVLKEHFQLILKALNHDFIDSEPLFLFDEKNDQALIVCCSHDERYIEEVKKRARSFSNGIVSTYLKVFDLHILGYMLPKNGQVENFLTLLKQEKLTV